MLQVTSHNNDFRQVHNEATWKDQIRILPTARRGSRAPSTVWDGDRTLFDMQFSALDVDPEECFRLALHDGIMLPIGEYMILPSPQRL
jgi:hypothetical protein